MTAKIINIKDSLPKKKVVELVENDDLSLPFFELYTTDDQLNGLLAEIEKGTAHNLRAQDMAISIVAYVSEQLRGMERLFGKVTPGDVEHEDLLRVMGVGQHCHSYMNMFLAKFTHYPMCLDLIRTAKNGVIYQELYISRAINDLLAKKFDDKPVLRFV